MVNISAQLLYVFENDAVADWVIIIIVSALGMDEKTFCLCCDYYAYFIIKIYMALKKYILTLAIQ